MKCMAYWFDKIWNVMSINKSTSCQLIPLLIQNRNWFWMSPSHLPKMCHNILVKPLFFTSLYGLYRRYPPPCICLYYIFFSLHISWENKSTKNDSFLWKNKSPVLQKFNQHCSHGLTYKYNNRIWKCWTGKRVIHKQYRGFICFISLLFVEWCFQKAEEQFQETYCSNHD